MMLQILTGINILFLPTNILGNMEKFLNFKIIKFFILILIIFSCDSHIKNQDLNLLPSIKNKLFTNEFSNLKPEKIYQAYSSKNNELPIRYGYTQEITKGDSIKSVIDFSIDEKINLDNEGYILKIEEEKIIIRAKDTAGLFYSFITLNQIIEDSKNNNTNLPIISIDDFPLLKFRPIHLDVKHHTEKKSYYFDLIDYLAKLKINGIIVEFEDKLKYETRTEVGSSDSFSIEWWIKLSEYANKRNIKISPLVQGLGHASYILKHAKNFHLRDKPDSDWAFNPLDPRTYELQFDLYKDAIRATPFGKYLHVGGDEVYLIEREGKTELELNLFWLNKVSEFAEKNNRIPIFWDDMPLKHAGLYAPMFDDKMDKKEVDEIWKKNEINLQSFIKKFPKNAIYMRWNYQKSHSYGNQKAMDWYTKNNLKVMGATAGQTRWTLMPRNQSNIPQIRSFALNSIEKKINGLLLTLWDDDSPHFELYKRGISAFAEYSWSGDNLSIEKFKSIYRFRNFGYLFYNDNFEFIDILERPAELWVNLLLSKDRGNSSSRGSKPGVSDIIDLPDLNKRGEWSKKYNEKIINARNSLKLSEKVDKIINNIKSKDHKNTYTLDVYQQVNELTKFTSNLILKLEKLDKEGDLNNISSVESEFNEVRLKFEDVYQKTRIINKPKDYILDQDHHNHPANQTINFDWQFLSEIVLLDKLKKKYN